MGKPKNSDIYKPNSYYHIYNRGNRKANIFYQEKDYETFRRLMYRYIKKSHIMIIVYCYMPNHFHFILKCGMDWQEIPAFMHAFMTGYALYFNRKYQKVGRIFQGPFQVRRIIGKRDLNKTIEYIMNNPERSSAKTTL
jgi:REP element-mobilizing transposase RayT